MQIEQRAEAMATTEELSTAKRYFQIRGGATVLEATGAHWIRWDRLDGPVATSIWRLDSPGLTELTEAEARKLIGSAH